MSETQILQTIGQLEASINTVEPYLDEEDFRNYCDSIYSVITNWRVILKHMREQSTDDINND